eukprot:TRINITY_DN15114_c0_g1_i1.p2 TRINITY_DN15114_c0_g1~~TRINITY_DN15114_c0_g1_i1.p2  ORF type:complete len:205 (+),score=79.09 TRINITY_DN15114_c0_g1_i1:696-1310(+)
MCLMSDSYHHSNMENREFKSSKKLEEVKNLYSTKLPALREKDETDAASAATGSSMSAMGKRWWYSDAPHLETASTTLRRSWLEQKGKAEKEAAFKETKRSLLHKHRLSTVPSKNPEGVSAEDLLVEIERYTRKLSNCKLELEHRRLEYYHVLCGGDPLDGSHEEEYDSDIEKDYAEMNAHFIHSPSMDNVPEPQDVSLCSYPQS